MTAKISKKAVTCGDEPGLAKKRKLAQHSPRVARLPKKKPHPPRGRNAGNRQRSSEAEVSNTGTTIAMASGTDAQSGFSSHLFEALLVLNLIFVRNKNQHRSQPWWKLFSLLRTLLPKIAKLEMRESALKENPAWEPGSVNANDVRQRFELEVQVRREREIACDWVRDVLCPQCYVAFSGLVGDAQFANLGLVLLGVLAEVAGALGMPKSTTAEEDDEWRRVANTGTARSRKDAKARSLTAQSLRVTGSEKGLLVDRIYDSDDLGEVVERESVPADAEDTMELWETQRSDFETEQEEDKGGGHRAEAHHDTHLAQEHQEIDVTGDIAVMLDIIDESEIPKLTKKGATPTLQATRGHASAQFKAKSTKKSAPPRPDTSQSISCPSIKSLTSISTHPPAPSKSTDLFARPTAPATNKTKTVTGSQHKKGRDQAKQEKETMKNIKSDKSSRDNKKTRKKKSNAIDDMFAGFG